MVQGILAFAFAALLALVAVSGSYDRATLQVTSDTARIQAVDLYRAVN
ncbi:MAG: hypothetical protein AAFQ09_02955 [Pseudomonadota bacterium]